jgi:hypothetical protein
MDGQGGSIMGGSLLHAAPSYGWLVLRVLLYLYLLVNFKIDPTAFKSKTEPETNIKAYKVLNHVMLG